MDAQADASPTDVPQGEEGRRGALSVTDLES